MAFSTIPGSGGAPDSFVGTSGVDSIAIVNTDGNFFLGAQQAADIVSILDSGSVLYNGVVGNATLKGGQGADTFTYGSGLGTIFNSVFTNLNANDDTFALTAGDTILVSTLQGGQGDDALNISGVVNASLINGNKDDDTIATAATTTITASSVFGGQGNDTFNSNNAAVINNSVINGDDGNDAINASFAAKDLNGSSISGGAGDDVITLTLSGNVATDTLFVNGNQGDDTISGPAIGTASLYGGAGIDTITANSVDGTTIVGGDGADLLVATVAGPTAFLYENVGQTGVVATGAVDVITGFATGVDTIGGFGLAGAVANFNTAAAGVANYAAALAAANTAFATAGVEYSLQAVDVSGGAGTAWSAYLFIDTTGTATSVANAAIQIGATGAYATDGVALASIVAADIIA